MALVLQPDFCHRAHVGVTSRWAESERLRFLTSSPRDADRGTAYRPERDDGGEGHIRPERLDVASATRLHATYGRTGAKEYGTAGPQRDLDREETRDVGQAICFPSHVQVKAVRPEKGLVRSFAGQTLLDERTARSAYSTALEASWAPHPRRRHLWGRHGCGRSLVSTLQRDQT